MNQQTNPHAYLRAASEAGARIQAWHLTGERRTSAEGEWETIEYPQFSCPAHLYRVHPEDEAKALAAWNCKYPTGHLPEGVRFYIELLVSNTDPAGMVRENELLREEVKRMAALVAELQP